MSTTNPQCKWCGRELSPDAKSCPHCGKRRQAPEVAGQATSNWLSRYSEADLAGRSETDLLTMAVVELSKIRLVIVWVWLLVPIAVVVLALLLSTADP